MKYVTFAALIASATASNPNYIIDGAAAEQFQGQVLNATRDAGEFIENDLAPNVNQYIRDQKETEEELFEAMREYNRESDQNAYRFHERGVAANYDEKLGNIARQLNQALADIDRNARSNGYYFRNQ